jgi:hypothetical protein
VRPTLWCASVPSGGNLSGVMQLCARSSYRMKQDIALVRRKRNVPELWSQHYEGFKNSDLAQHAGLAPKAAANNAAAAATSLL